LSVRNHVRRVKRNFEAAHSYGGLVFHDVTTIKHAKRALQAGVDGLILVATGAGGHAGRLSPFAFVPEVRQFYDGCVILAGAIASGGAILAAQALGADLAYIGTRFIASEEANAPAAYKMMIIASSASDIVYTSLFTGVHGNYLKGSIVNAGLDPDNLPESDKTKMDFGSGSAKAKAWRDIWGAGQGVGQVEAAPPAADVGSRLEREYGRRSGRSAPSGQDHARADPVAGGLASLLRPRESRRPGAPGARDDDAGESPGNRAGRHR
jgi:nitronate monooxygenase